MNKPFLEMLKRMEAIHNKKSADYAKDTNLYSNFEFSGLLASKFKHPVDISMAALIGTKLERLSNLLDSDKAPQNESVEDNFLDLCTYMALWAAYRSYVSDKPVQLDSERACCNMIDITQNLNDKHLDDIISYLEQVKISRNK